MSGKANSPGSAGRGSSRGFILIISILLIWAVFGCVAYKCADAALNTLSSEYSEEVALRIRFGLVIVALIAGVVFAALKFACQCVYGLVEVAVAAVMAAELAKTALSKEPFAALIGLVAIAYIVVRGLENTVKGTLVLQEKQRRGEILLGPLAEKPKAAYSYERDS